MLTWEGVLGSLLDTILDRTVILGYTSPGYRIGRRLWDARDLQPIDGKTVLVTGVTSGLGLAGRRGVRADGREPPAARAQRGARGARAGGRGRGDRARGRRPRIASGCGANASASPAGTQT